MAIFHLAAAPLVLRMYRELTNTAPDELMAHTVMADVPDFGPAMIVQAVYSGTDRAEGERLLAPLRRFGPPAIDLIDTRSYADLYMMLTPPIPPGATYYDTAYTLKQPSDAALDDLFATAQERPSPLTFVNVHQFHGAATRVAPDATALALREPHFAIVNIGMWLEGTGAGGDDLDSECQGAHGPTRQLRAVCELPGRRGRGRDPRQLPQQLRPAGGDQGGLRSRQHLPPQPEHQAGEQRLVGNFALAYCPRERKSVRLRCGSCFVGHFSPRRAKNDLQKQNVPCCRRRRCYERKSLG